MTDTLPIGDEEELNDPKIQQALIQHGYVEEIVGGLCRIDFITNEKIIENVLGSNLFEDSNISYKQGRIDNVTFVEDKENNSMGDLIPYCVHFEFTEKTTSEIINFKEHRLFTAKDIESYKTNIQKYRDNIIVILENKKGELYLRCFCKAYKLI